MIPGFFPIAKGGAEMFALNLCKNLQLQGHYLQILTRNLDLPREGSWEGIQIRRFTNILPYKIKFYGFGRFFKSKYIRILVAFFDLLGVIPALWKLHRKNRFQMIHASFILPFGLAGVLVKNFLKLPLVVTVHGPADFYEVPRIFDPILRFVLKRADAVVAVSPRLMRDLIIRLGKLPIKLIVNGIPLDLYKHVKKPYNIEKYEIFSQDFVILTAGRLVKRKNLHILIRAVPKILKEISNCKVVILGSGIEKENLQILIEQLNLESNVILPGWVSEEEKIMIFKRSDIFIQLSQVEGLSLALLESKAAGIPAIIIERGNLDPISDEKTGLFIRPPVTPDKIVDSVEVLHQNKDLRLKIGKNVKEEGERLYSLQKMVENYIKLYQRVLKNYR